MSLGAETLNAEFVGAAGSRAILETPALLLDADAFEKNVATLAGLAREAGIGLRPHAKTHKCAGIAKAQIAAGALGVACAKSGELLALFEAGVTALMLTAPVASRRSRLRPDRRGRPAGACQRLWGCGTRCRRDHLGAGRLRYGSRANRIDQAR